MTKKEHENDEGVVKDGEVLRVPLHLMDAQQRAIAKGAVHDGLGNRAGQKPGYAFAAPAGGKAASDCFDAYDERISQAWKQGDLAAQTAQPKTLTRDQAYAEYEARVQARWKNAA